MPKKGYKQTKEHRLKIAEAHRKYEKKSLMDESRNPFRDYTCVTYHICLRNAALFNLRLDCTDCPNWKHQEPKPSDAAEAVLTQEAVACVQLIKAVLHPQAWKLEDRARQKAMQEGMVDGGQEDQPEPRVEWWG